MWTTIKWRTIKRSAAILGLGAAMLSPLHAQDNKADIATTDEVTLQQLLDQVRAGRVTDNAEFQAREDEFRNNRNKQKTLLTRTQTAIKREEARSERLEKDFSEKELKLAELEGLLNERLGVFGELFGIVRQVAGETKAQVDESAISGELKGRSARLESLSKTKGLPEIKELEYLWFTLQQEMTAQGEVKRFYGEVVNLDGSVREAEILRVGPFTTLSDGQFVRYAGNGRYADLGRQPPARFGDAADDLDDGDAGVLVAAPVDPSRGAILNLFLQMPNLFERINQGGLVGYIILLLGIGGVGIAVERITRLTLMARAVKAQLASGQAAGDTPLGRVWDAYQSNASTDVETLELKLDDAILKEMPALEKSLPLLKLLSGVAPLLGLLGTVTGMILTFQAITLFGTGDPKLMAGGISQALMTTVLGLVVAIPILLLHSVAATRSREIVQILEEQAAGMIATHAEKN
ncbi:MAG: MotA/TolQ/ExbB proton channel family protein [Rhodobiaceae bacterium]|jgi:biopolymer transport protein ExbB|nr:MotA/TolQ/ExbB proton channel family protein [Rhodobiaceae bacterium]